MAEKDKVFDGKISHSGIFSFKDLYTFCYEWISEEGFDILESDYSEKITPRGKEINISWSCDKNISDYFKFEIKVGFSVNGLVDVEIERDGKKEKSNKGSVGVKISSTIVKDRQGKWENNPSAKFMRGTYEKFIIGGRVSAYEGKIFGIADEFLGQVKSFLALEAKH